MASPRREAATTPGGRPEAIAGVSSVDLGGATALDGSVTDPITGQRAFELEQAPDCTDDSPKTYQGYRVRAVGGDADDAADNAILYLNPRRNANTGVAAVLTDVVDGCEGDVYIDGSLHGTYETNKVSFGSA